MEDHHRLAALAAVLVAALAGCGSGSSSSASSKDVRASVNSFVKAFGAGDGKAACALMTADAQASFVQRVRGPLGTPDCPSSVAAAHGEAAAELNLDFKGARVKSVKVNGKSATAVVSAGSRSLAAQLSQTGGHWLLTGVPGL